MVAKLVNCGMFYSKPTSTWAAAPILLLKHGLSKYHFTFNLRPVNLFTDKNQFPKPILEQELKKVILVTDVV